MPSTIKELTRIVRGNAEVLLGDGESPLPTCVNEAEGFLLIALAALKEAETSITTTVQEESGTNLMEEMKSVRKSLKCIRRQLLVSPSSPVLPPHDGTRSDAVPFPGTGVKRSREEDEGSSGGTLDLGQYAGQETNLFGGNTGKMGKFARLMGGGKKTVGGSAPLSTSASLQNHSTLAASSSDMKRMNNDLEREFNYALQHKNRKGLGA